VCVCVCLCVCVCSQRREQEGVKGSFKPKGVWTWTHMHIHTLLHTSPIYTRSHRCIHTHTHTHTQSSSPVMTFGSNRPLNSWMQLLNPYRSNTSMFAVSRINATSSLPGSRKWWSEEIYEYVCVWRLISNLISGGAHENIHIGREGSEDSHDS